MASLTAASSGSGVENRAAPRPVGAEEGDVAAEPCESADGFAADGGLGDAAHATQQVYLVGPPLASQLGGNRHGLVTTVLNRPAGTTAAAGRRRCPVEQDGGAGPRKILQAAWAIFVFWTTKVGSRSVVRSTRSQVLGDDATVDAARMPRLSRRPGPGGWFR